MRSPYFWIATFFGIGKIPWAPGTFASLAAMFLFFPLVDKPILMAGILVGVYFLGVFACTRLEKETGDIDPSYDVIDEVLGMGVAMLAIPKEWYYVVMALILFRLFDIWKPFPIRKLEKLPGGWGVMTDDLLAGIIARVWIQVGLWSIHFIQ